MVIELAFRIGLTTKVSLISHVKKHCQMLVGAIINQ